MVRSETKWLLLGVVLVAGFAVAQQAPSGTVRLTWEKPTQLVNGDPYTDPKGYRVYWGVSPSALTNTLDVSGEDTLTVDIPNIGVGNFYFYVAAVTMAGKTSALSQGTQLDTVVPMPPSNVSCSWFWQMVQTIAQTIQCQ